MSVARRYAGFGNATNTQSATLPMFNLTSTAAIRTRIFELNFGSDATPADQASKFVVARSTSTGTAGGSVTPSPLDNGDPACVSVLGAAVGPATPFSVAPTGLTAVVLQWAQNARANFRWIAAPDSELVAPATSGNGFACLPTVVTAAQNYAWTVLFAE